MSDCIFCKIVSGEIPSDIVYESDSVVAFNDLNPQAPFHVLIVPKKHIPTLNDMTEEDRELIGGILLTASHLAKENGFSEVGYRTLFNCNRGAGQTVFHVHLHLLGGRPFTWPPG